MQVVPEAILESKWVTLDPKQADLFYVPAAFYCQFTKAIAETGPPSLTTPFPLLQQYTFPEQLLIDNGTTALYL